MVFTFFADKYKDILYTVRFPHSDAYVTFFLWFSLSAPFVLIYIFDGNFCHSLKVYFSLDVIWDNSNKKISGLTRLGIFTIIAVYENLIQILCQLIDMFYFGHRVQAYQGFIPILGFFMISKVVGYITGMFYK